MPQTSVMSTDINSAIEDAKANGESVDGLKSASTDSTQSTSNTSGENKESDHNKEGGSQTSSTSVNDSIFKEFGVNNAAELKELLASKDKEAGEYKSLLLEKTKEEIRRRAGEKAKADVETEKAKKTGEFFGFESQKAFEEEYDKNPAQALQRMLQSYIDPQIKPLVDKHTQAELKQMHDNTWKKYPEFAPGTEGFKAGKELAKKNPLLLKALDEIQGKHGVDGTEIMGIVANYPIMKARLEALQEKYEKKPDATKTTGTQSGSTNGEQQSEEDIIRKECLDSGITDEDMIKQIIRTTQNSFGMKRMKK